MRRRCSSRRWHKPPPLSNRPAPVLGAGEHIVVGLSRSRKNFVCYIDGSIGSDERGRWKNRLADPARGAADRSRDCESALHGCPGGGDDSGGSQLVVLETISGHVIGRRKFGQENAATQLINFAMSEEGTLLYTLPSRLYAKDLYEPWKNGPSE